MKKSGLTRRGFVKGMTVAAGTVMIVPQTVWGANDQLNVASIGVGGKGGSDIGDITGCGGKIVALCDTDKNQVGNQAKKFADAKQYSDFRKMFDEMHKDIDAVTVSTPDHTHFPASMAAIMLKKHVFCQKPLVHNVWEARMLAKAAKEAGVATQMGIQGHAHEYARLLAEWIWADKLGTVKEVHYYTNRPIWPQGIDTPKEAMPVPANLDWDNWLTVAPERPYHKAYCPFAWRGWFDYGAGALGDIGCHVMDAMFWALDLRDPVAITAEFDNPKPDAYPAWSRVTYEFAARGKRGPVKLLWCDGKKEGKPNEPPKPKELDGVQLNKETYAIVYGDKNVAMHDFYCGNARIYPEAKMQEANVKAVPKTLKRSPGGHMKEFVLACKGGEPAMANFDYAASLSEMVVLGNLAIRAGAGKRLEWDPKAMKMTNSPEATRYVRREPRKGWDQYYKGPEVPPQPEIKLGYDLAPQA